MDTDSTDKKGPKSWRELAARARQAEPAPGFDVSGRIRRAVAAEGSAVSARSSWLEQVNALFEYRWLAPALGSAVASVAVVLWFAAGAWSDVSFALSFPFPLWDRFL